MRILHLYRPKLPSLRAQDIQVVHSAHAMARRGHEVTLLADRREECSGVPDALGILGLAEEPGLLIQLSPHRQKGLAGIWFRSKAARWWMGEPGAVVARDARRLLELCSVLPARHRVVFESHGLPSAQAWERGEDPSAAAAQERRLLGTMDSLVTNCGGTMAAWSRSHPGCLPESRGVVHNATHPSRSGQAAERSGIRCVGSLQLYKGAEFYAEAAGSLPCTLDWIGADPSIAARLEVRSDNIRFHPPRPYPAVPALLQSSAALLLPLQDNLFGRQLTSPLKLWDYLATEVPIIAPDLPSVREIEQMSGTSFFLHRPGKGSSLAEQAARAVASGTRKPFLRTWDERAAEMERFLGGER